MTDSSTLCYKKNLRGDTYDKIKYMNYLELFLKDSANLITIYAVDLLLHNNYNAFFFVCSHYNIAFSKQFLV